MTVAPRALALVLLCACIPDPRGQCAADADCAAGPPGSFCADSICSGPPRGSIDSLAGRTFARTDTAPVRIHVERSHGAATARVILAGAAVAAQRLPDGTLAAALPLNLAPAGVEGPVPFDVELRDDLGHLVTLPGALLVDDLAPRITVDPASLPKGPVLRGTPLTLRVTVDDLSPTVVAGATRSADGSFSLPVDTRALQQPAATALDVAISATDAVGNTGTAHASFGLTRLKFKALDPLNLQVMSLVLGDSMVWANLNQAEVWILDRASGAQIARPAAGSPALAEFATDGARLFFARRDNALCRMGGDGVIQVCDPVGATLTRGPILDGKTAIVATGGTAFASQRLSSMLDDQKSTLLFTNPLADFASNMPAIGPDGVVYVGGSNSVATARPTSLDWITGKATAEQSVYQGQPAFRGGSVLFLVSGTGSFDSFVFTDPLGSPAPPPTPTRVVNAGIALTSPTIAADGTALFATSDRHLIAVRPDNSVRWNATLSDPATAPPTNGSGDLVYLGTLGGDILALNLADGSTAWKYSAGARINGPLAAGCDGVLYAALDGAVLALAIDSPGLAASPWPMASHDVRGSGDARRPLRTTTSACLE